MNNGFMLIIVYPAWALCPKNIFFLVPKHCDPEVCSQVADLPVDLLRSSVLSAREEAQASSSDQTVLHWSP